MATLLRSANFRAPPPSLAASTSRALLKSSSPFCVSFRNNNNKCAPNNSCLYSHHFTSKVGGGVPRFVILASSGEAIETETQEPQQQQQQPDIQDNTDGAVNGVTSEEPLADDSKPDSDESPTSPVITALQLYKEALSNDDDAKVAELETFFKSIEDEKNALERKVLSLSEDFSTERERVLRISADFDNFRKRTERERNSLVTNAQGEVIENFLPVLDNFERAKTQIKVETEAEEKIRNNYQSIYKQFSEILNSIGVIPVETIGKPFDPMLHEAIMRDESTEYEEGIVIEEYRKGFKLGDRLLRPSMVKVSAGPGPEKKPEESESSVQDEAKANTSEVVDGEGDSMDQTTA